MDIEAEIHKLKERADLLYDANTEILVHQIEIKKRLRALEGW